MAGQHGERKLSPLGWIVVVIIGIIVLANLGSGEAVVLVFVGIPLLILFLIIRALVRVGDKRPEPVRITAPAAPGVAAGWYPDQVDPRFVRWFDGQRWTEAVLPRDDQGLSGTG